MGLVNNVERVGRIEYIEPNNLFYNSDGNKVQNGIPQPYEDYSFSVNLRVINGDRYACGMTDDGGDMANNYVEFSSDNGTLSFMDGTTAGGQSYLTTNFTDINMNNPETNTKECLGIESITIKYDSWFYPTVDIRFIDVRGASLMLPAEYEYYNNGNPNPIEGKNAATTNSDFFKAFFSFPYPLFKLSVKGFYGKEVTYDLSVLNCNVSFNSSIGCFEINASFIGYMYGMYADLPFPFAYVAPYISLYGKNTWEEKKNSGDFCYIGNGEKDKPTTKMYTFPELRTAVQDAGEKADKELEVTPDGKRKIELKNLLNELNQNILLRYPMTSKDYTWWSWSDKESEEERDGFFYLPIEITKESNRKIFDTFLTFSTNLQKYNDLASKTEYYNGQKITSKKIFDDFLKDTEDIRKKKNTTETGSTIYTDDEVESVLSRNIVTLSFHKEGSKENTALIFDDDNKSSFGKNNKADYQKLISIFKEKFKKDDITIPMHKTSSETNWTLMVFKFENINFRGGITNKISELGKNLDELQTKLDKERDQRITKSIGFDPTIKNLYNMIFAHIDTFMSCFYNTLDRIRQKIQSDDKSRSYKRLCGNSISTDVNENALKSESSNGGKLPPFTMFYREETIKDSEDKKVVMVWPGELNGGEKLDEVKLVEEIINATSLEKRSYDAVTPKDNVIEREGDLAPINYYDIIREGGNPYLDILSEKNLENEASAKLMLDIFLYRCFYTMMGGSYVASDAGSQNDGTNSATANFTKKAKLVAEIEVGNVERAFQMLDMNPFKAFLVGLNKLSNDGKDLLNYYTSGDAPLLKSIGNGEKLVYNGIPRFYEGRLYCNYLPVGTFVPSVIEKLSKSDKEKLGTDIAKFLVISPSGSIKNDSITCRLYTGGKKLESVINKYTSGDFSSAAKLFPNYGTLPHSISDVSFENGTFKKEEKNCDVSLLDLYNDSVSGFISLPSSRKTDAGITNIFMDPLYYAQTSREARAYMFLMGVPFGKDKKYFLPKVVENGAYPTLMLLREGAYYWRNEGIITREDEGKEVPEFVNDPITYEYTINGVVIHALDDIEKNDPCFGRKNALEFYENPPKKSSRGRKQVLMDFFLKWADGISPENNPDVVIPTVTAASNVHVEVPSTNISFLAIEQNLGLWEPSGQAKQLLTSTSCESAVTVEMAGTFANATSLNFFYNIGTDGRLGKISEGKKIRTDVFLRKSSDIIGNAPAEYTKFYTDFEKFYTGLDTIIDFSCLDAPSTGLTVPNTAMSDALGLFINGLKDTYKISIKKINDGVWVDSSGQPEDRDKNPEYFKSRDLKLACYIALKSMYDRWLCNRRRECWNFSCDSKKMSHSPIKSDFLRFYYIDEFYHNAGMKVRPDLTQFINNACKLGAFTEESNSDNLASTSIIKILSMTAQYGNCSLLTLPTMLGLANTKDSERNSISDVFKAFTYNEAVKNDSIETSFIVLSTSQKSAVLNVPDDKGKMGYKSDGFDIANTWGKIIPNPMFSDAENDGFVVPSFGVTFAKQNQSFFKDVRLSMEDHQVTDFSIRNQLMISYQSNRGPRETTMVGQNLYSVYSNYSYNCTVTMMGDAQITPLMYFQLNNIPMWKGAYLITNVHHEITTHGMETVFTGVRQARPTTPYKDDSMVVAAAGAAKQTAYSQEETHIGTGNDETHNSNQTDLDKIDISRVKGVTFILDRTSITTNENWINGLLSVSVTYNDDSRENIPNVAQTLEPVLDNKHIMGTSAEKVENFTPPKDTRETYRLPSGRLSIVRLEDAPPGKEYRDSNDTFYKFTDGKHIVISESKLLPKYSEIITGETVYRQYMDTGSTDFHNFGRISLGGISPLMVYPPADPEDSFKQLGSSNIRTIYKQIFNFLRRLKEAGKPVNFLINETDDILSRRIDLLL